MESQPKEYVTALEAVTSSGKEAAIVRFLIAHSQALAQHILLRQRVGP
jgi:hypothetical protein